MNQEAGSWVYLKKPFELVSPTSLFINHPVLESSSWTFGELSPFETSQPSRPRNLGARETFVSGDVSIRRKGRVAGVAGKNCDLQTTLAYYA